MTDLAWFFFPAAIAIAALLAVWHECAVAKARRRCELCGGREGAHEPGCRLRRAYRDAA